VADPNIQSFFIKTSALFNKTGVQMGKIVSKTVIIVTITLPILKLPNGAKN